MKSFLNILSFIKNYKGKLSLNLFFNVLNILFSVFSIVMVVPFLSLLFQKIPLNTQEPSFGLNSTYIIDYVNYQLSLQIAQNGPEAALVRFCIFIVIVFFFKNLFRYAAQFFMAPIRNGVVRDVRNQLFNKMASLPLSYFTNERKGEIMTKMSADVQEIELGIMSTIEAIIKEPLTIIIYMAAMLTISPKLTTFVLLMVIITGLIIGQIGKTLKRKSSKAQQQLGGLMSLVDETLTGMRIIKSFVAEQFQIRRFSSYNQKHFQILNAVRWRSDLSSPLSEFLGIVIVAIVLWFGSKSVLADKLEPETFIGFMFLFSQLIPPAKSFSSAFYKIQKGLASTERVFSMLNLGSEALNDNQADSLTRFEQKIEIKDLGFAYEDANDKRILSNINLTIKKGSTIALVGQSGAGKTTLVDLLPRFYDYKQGQILIDGKEITNYKLAELRKLMGVVSQQSILFNDSILNNIAFGKTTFSEDEIVEAAKIANCHDFIMPLEHGYQTIIGEGGNKLSGGEKQRITIARAILQNPPILILDEATSSLDSKSEMLVQNALLKLMKNRTSIVIAHRLSTIQFADEIVVMQDGQIIEQGNHISLIAQNGAYKKLVELQAF